MSTFWCLYCYGNEGYTGRKSHVDFAGHVERQEFSVPPSNGHCYTERLKTSPKKILYLMVLFGNVHYDSIKVHPNFIDLTY